MRPARSTLPAAIVRAVLCWVLLGFPAPGRAGGCPCWECPENCPDTCPCWTPAELAGIHAADLCYACGNWIDAGGPPAADASCVHINGNPLGGGGFPPCEAGFPNSGWVQVWDQAPLYGHQPPGCLIWSEQVPAARFVSPLTLQQTAACIADIVALGTATAAANPGIPYGCLGQCFPPGCRMTVLDSRCDFDMTRCASDSDCETIGNCNVDLVPCVSEDDCQWTGNCAASTQACYTTGDCPLRCSQTLLPCVDESACPGAANVCGPTPCVSVMPQFCDGGIPGTCGDYVVFTHQPFALATGLRSELIADGDFSSTLCHGVATPAIEAPGPFALIDDPTDDPPEGDVRYYLTRAVEGVSCLDHGDSSLVPDPRDALDASCP